MAATAHKTEEEKKEFFDSEEVLEEKITTLSQLIKKSKHFVAFTGAGISTSAGVPDYRSGINTVLKTGPGAWEKAATKQKSGKKHIRVQMSKAVPTSTHMALVKLIDEGLLKFVISQNVDGLHRRSGIVPSKLAEVHGNTNLERCAKCAKEYMRDFRVRNAQRVKEHQTGRVCDNPKCKGKLKDTIINFGENLPERDLDYGFNHCAFADLCLAMGSSLTVTPAASMPEATAAKGGKLIIVNLQKTPLDSCAFMKINALCDTVIERLMKKLELDIPAFKLVRRLHLQKLEEEKKSPDPKILVKGVDSDGCPFSLFTQVDVKVGDKLQTSKREPFIFPSKAIGTDKTMAITLYWQGHYGEKKLTLNVDLKEFEELKYMVEFDLSEKSWKVSEQ